MMNHSTIEMARQTEALLSGSELCGGEAMRAREVIERLENQHITVSVIGQFKRGKSTLVNAILGEKLLPVGIVPVTSAVTRIQYGEPAVEVHFENGAVVPVAVEALSDYISEQKNQGNHLGVASVTMRTRSDFLKEGLTFVDTPGVGSAHKHNSDAAYAFVQESDAVIFMLSVDSPINEIEIDFLHNAREYAAKFYFVVNKIDTVDEDELDIYIDYCRRLLCDLMEVDEVFMFPVSAKRGAGLPELVERIQVDCRTSVKEILETSARMKLSDIISCAISQLDLYWKALQMPMSSFDDKFAAMESCFAKLKEKSETAVAQMNREIEELKNTAEESLKKDVQSSGGQEKELKRSCGRIANGLMLTINEMKRFLSDSVSEQFGMEYHYDIEELNVKDGGSWAKSISWEKNRAEEDPLSRKKAGTQEMEADMLVESAVAEDAAAKGTVAEMEDVADRCALYYSGLLNDAEEALEAGFRSETEKLCSDLNESLNKILLYKEQNAYTVARRIEDLNQLTRKLKKLRGQLSL